MARIGLVSSMVLFFGLFLTVGAVSAVEAPRMTKEELKPMMGDANVAIIDVRAGHDWEESKSKIKGAVREDPSKVQEWISKYPKDKTIVLYCA